MTSTKEQILQSVLEGIIGEKYNPVKYGTMGSHISKSIAYLIDEDTFSVRQIIDACLRAVQAIDSKD